MSRPLKESRSRDGWFAVRLLHFPDGWRYWAHERRTGRDVEIGLDPDGYNTEEEAWRAVENVTLDTETT